MPTVQRLFGLSLAAKLTPPAGGFNLDTYKPFVVHLIQEACKPFFLGQELEILRIAKHYPFGASACRQPWSALIITMRAPPGMALLRLPKWVDVPNGKLDHPSWHDSNGGMVPQSVAAMPLWFVRGCLNGEEFVVKSSVASTTTDPGVVRQLQAIKDRVAQPSSRLTRGKRAYDNKVRARPKGADISDLRDPRRLSRPSRARNFLNRTSRSRSRSPSESRSASRSRTDGCPEQPAAPSPAVANVPTAGNPRFSNVMALYHATNAAAPATMAGANAPAAAPALLGPSVASLGVNPSITLADAADQAILAGVNGMGVGNPDTTMLDLF